MLFLCEYFYRYFVVCKNDKYNVLSKINHFTTTTMEQIDYITKKDVTPNISQTQDNIRKLLRTKILELADASLSVFEVGKENSIKFEYDSKYLGTVTDTELREWLDIDSKYNTSITNIRSSTILVEIYVTR